MLRSTLLQGSFPLHSLLVFRLVCEFSSTDCFLLVIEESSMLEASLWVCRENLENYWLGASFCFIVSFLIIFSADVPRERPLKRWLLVIELFLTVEVYCRDVSLCLSLSLEPSYSLSCTFSTSSALWLRLSIALGLKMFYLCLLASKMALISYILSFFFWQKASCSWKKAVIFLGLSFGWTAGLNVHYFISFWVTSFLSSSNFLLIFRPLILPVCTTFYWSSLLIPSFLSRIFSYLFWTCISVTPLNCKFGLLTSEWWV